MAFQAFEKQLRDGGGLMVWCGDSRPHRHQLWFGWRVKGQVIRYKHWCCPRRREGLDPLSEWHELWRGHRRLTNIRLIRHHFFCDTGTWNYIAVLASLAASIGHSSLSLRMRRGGSRKKTLFWGGGGAISSGCRRR